MEMFNVRTPYYTVIKLKSIFYGVIEGCTVRNPSIVCIKELRVHSSDCALIIMILFI